MEKLINIRLFVTLFFILAGGSLLYAQDNTNSNKKEKASEANLNNSIRTGSPNDSTAQSKSTFNKQPVIDEIKAQLATMSTKMLQELLEFCKKKEIQGEFVADITVEGKGKILTVFMVSGGEDDIPKKNLLKGKLAELSFENIKIPKKERVKFRYTFKF